MEVEFRACKQLLPDLMSLSHAGVGGGGERKVSWPMVVEVEVAREGQ